MHALSGGVSISLCLLLLVHFPCPAMESGMSEGLLGGVSLPIRTVRHAISYDDALDAPIGSPPSDMIVNILWEKPVIPERRFRRLVEVYCIGYHAVSFKIAINYYSY